MSRRAPGLRRAVRAAALGLAVVGAVRYARGHREQVLGVVKRFNKHALNPVMMRFAGRGGFYASVIHHTGRRSGRTYDTPVLADPVEDGFLIPLPYGDTEWCRNVVAAGGATIDRHDETYVVTGPEVIGADAALAMLPPRVRAARARVRPERFLHVHVAPPAGVPT